MVYTLAVSLGLLAACHGDAAANDATLQAYQAARAQTPREPDAQVRLALWCESHGLNAERVKHLALAVLADPNHATARGLLGLVRYRGQWQKPDDVGRQVAADAELAAALAEYNARRGVVRNTAADQWELGLWCKQAGLEAEAKAHFTAVVRLAPSHRTAWKKLGYQNHRGRWMTEEQVKRSRAEAELQKRANRQWLSELGKTISRLREKKEHAAARAFLATVVDPRAVPAVWKLFVVDGGSQTIAVQVLGQIDAPAASRALAMLALYGSTVEVRRAATETLRMRDAREFAHLLIQVINPPITYHAKRGMTDTEPSELLIEGKDANQLRRYWPQAAPRPEALPGDVLTFDEEGRAFLARHQLFETFVGPGGPFSPGFGAGPPSLPLAGTLSQPYEVFAMPGSPFANPWTAWNRGWQSLDGGFDWTAMSGMAADPASAPRIYVIPKETVKRLASGPAGLLNSYLVFRRDFFVPLDAPVAAQVQMANDVRVLEAYNDAVKPLNDRAVRALEQSTGNAFGTDREKWKGWWVDQIGYAYRARPYEKPTVVENVPISSPVFAQDRTVDAYQRISCFGAGTPVHTLSGLRPIETLKVGDQVLTQDTRTGALSYQPVLVAHHNPPSKTFLVRLGDETIVSSPFHRFWCAGKGWVMARELKEGQTLRTVEGLATISQISEGPEQKVYNLDVAETGSFFVGEQGILVHDNTLPGPAQQRFDAPPELASAKR